MADLGLEEDDELERFKRWWKNNGLALVLGAVVGIAAILAWQGWQAWRAHVTMGAATAYMEFQHALRGSAGTDKLVSMVAHLQSNYGGSPYAGQAGLALAEYFVIHGKPKRAITSLQWVAQNADQTPLRNIARLRRARLLWGQGKLEAALEQLQHPHPEAFTALYAELTGDIQADAGHQAEAREAYQKALVHLPPGGDPAPIRRKLNAVAGGSAKKNAEVS